MAWAALVHCCTKERFSELSPKFSDHVVTMMAPPISITTAAASKGATGPKAKVSTSRWADSPATMAMRPLPKSTALEKVGPSHPPSKPLYMHTALLVRSWEIDMQACMKSLCVTQACSGVSEDSSLQQSHAGGGNASSTYDGPSAGAVLVIFDLIREDQLRNRQACSVTGTHAMNMLRIACPQ